MNATSRRFLSLLSVCIPLAACGGGGGGDRGQPPVAAFSATVYVGESPLDVRFDASGSTDPDGRIESYSWNFGDGTTADQPIVGHRFEEPKPYRVTLTVTDDTGRRHETSAVLTAIEPGPDPLAVEQWHLGVINKTYPDDATGDGVRVAVVDDGLQIMHPDLSANIVNGGSYNYLDGGSDPTPRSGSNDAHGTAVAGLAAARDFNSEGGRGIAPRAELVGYNVLQNPTSSNQADAMTRGRDVVGVSSNSWGAPDLTGQLQPSGLNWRTAIDTGLAEGRGGLGTVYTWAAGNGHVAYDSNGQPVVIDNSNYDGQANHYGVIAVGAVDHNGSKTSYSEPGANLWVVAPGGGGSCGADTMTTTDLTGDAGLNPGFSDNDLSDADYTRCMNGTSAATPLVAGTVALMLQANPNLSWRDVRVILARSARQNDASDPDWQTNAPAPPTAAYHINHKYGFGLVDAQAAVDLAKTWTPLPPMTRYAAPQSGAKGVDVQIPDNAEPGVQDTMTISGSGIDAIEWVDVEFTSDHDYAGDLEIVLTSPTDTQSRLSERHLCQSGQCAAAVTGPDGIWRWRFGSARHLGEDADGRWTLTVVDKATDADLPGTGRFVSWRLVIRGHQAP
jgi:proprotein convertase subtilisin/kexin type 2